MNKIKELKIKNFTCFENLEFNSLKNNELKAELQQKNSKFNAIYIPAQEILSTYTNYLNYSEIVKYKLDSTYLHLAESLNKKKNKVYPLSSFYESFNNILKGEIINTKNGYCFQKGNDTFQSSLVGDGIKKLGTYKLLLENKEINKNTILFIDEPEVHLNPKLISFFVSFIIELSAKGVQIFLSSHNYLLIYLLSLKSEYSNETPISFFSLYETKKMNVKYDFGKQLSDLENNTIVQEYESLFEIEQEYFTSKQNAND
ncbi:MAG: AAA family ATPase [Flavobacteriales bacterium]